MLYNPYFTQMLNPAYLDVLDCPYLNYAKSPGDEPADDEHKKTHTTVPEQNVSDFLDALKYDWESLPKNVKDKYYSKLTDMINSKDSSKKPRTENFEGSSINTAYPNDAAPFVINGLTQVGIILYILFKDRIPSAGMMLVVYLTLVTIGGILYYFSHR